MVSERLIDGLMYGSAVIVCSSAIYILPEIWKYWKITISKNPRENDKIIEELHR